MSSLTLCPSTSFSGRQTGEYHEGIVPSRCQSELWATHLVLPWHAAERQLAGAVDWIGRSDTGAALQLPVSDDMRR